MFPPISPDDLATLIDEAAVAARRLHQRENDPTTGADGLGNLGLEARFGRQAVLVPNELLDFGEVTYFSGRRDDAQIQAIAAARMARGHDLARN